MIQTLIYFYFRMLFLFSYFVLETPEFLELTIFRVTIKSDMTWSKDGIFIKTSKLKAGVPKVKENFGIL